MADARTRLVDAAAELVHSDGFHRTSLARIADRAGVPVGNVYYYFPTKAAIADAVVERLSDGQAALRRRWERHGDPRERAPFLTRSTGHLDRDWWCPDERARTLLGYHPAGDWRPAVCAALAETDRGRRWPALVQN